MKGPLESEKCIECPALFRAGPANHQSLVGWYGVECLAGLDWEPWHWAVPLVAFLGNDAPQVRVGGDTAATGFVETQCPGAVAVAAIKNGAFGTGDSPPRSHTEALRSLFDNFGYAPAAEREEPALSLDAAIRAARRDEWRGNRFKEREICQAMADVLEDNAVDIDSLFKIVENPSDY